MGATNWDKEKRILRKVFRKSSLNYEEIQSVMFDIESIINNRSLIYASEDLNDIEPLTPPMFMQEVKGSSTSIFSMTNN